MPPYTLSNITNPFNVQNNCVVDNRRSGILNWLSPLEPRLRHRDIQERRVGNVGEWLLQTEEFRSWHGGSGESEGDKAVLFCYGGPGVGKTFISSLVVDRLCDQVKGQNTAVLSCYLDFAAQEEQSVIIILGSLLRQVVGGIKEVPIEIYNVCHDEEVVYSGRGPRLSEIVKLLQTMTSLVRTFICIDSLDECPAVHRVKLLDSLRRILERSPRTRIFITGSPHVQAETEEHLGGQVASVDMNLNRDHIGEYLRLRLHRDETPDAMNESLKADIIQKMTRKISEIFLLVSLNIDTILHESTIPRRRERLNRLAEGLELGDVYSATIDRIKAQDRGKSRLGMAALMWVSHAERPLRADELCHALAVQLGSTDFDFGNVPSMSTLVSSCQGLLTVDKEGSTVRLIHFTLQEYLSSRPDIFGKAHSAIAEICLTYLNSEKVKGLSAIPLRDALNIPFLEYSSVYWGVHAKMELSGHGRSLALELLKGYYSLISTKLLLAHLADVKHFNYQRFDPLSSYNTLSPFNGLHCASFFGIAEAVVGLITMECHDLNEGDSSGCGPLAWAARNGHEEVVKILLGQEDINAEKVDKDDQTPLSLAAEYGHDGVVKILLGREGANADRPDRWGRTPLTYAARYGHSGVVLTLLGREEVNSDRPDSEGQTPFLHAARKGYERVVRVLLKQEEVNPDRPDSKGRTPMSHAARKGHEEVVKILLEREEVKPDEPDSEGQTGLFHAAENGHGGMVKILLERAEVNPDKADNHGRTPLASAAREGHARVAKILLGREEVNPDKPDRWSHTPLASAAQEGHERVVKILLEREEVNPDKPNYEGRTPLSHAAGRGYEGIVRILLAQEEVNPDKPDDEGQTPLSRASQSGHEGVAKILLGRKEVNPDKPDNEGRTPLLHAAVYEKEGVVKILLEREYVEPDKPDNDGRTPLSHAAQYGREGLVKILLERKEVDPDKPDDRGRTPFWYAAWYGRVGVVEILLGREEVNPDKPDHDGQTPLSAATTDSERQPLYCIREGCKKVVALLQSRKPVTPTTIQNL